MLAHFLKKKNDKILKKCFSTKSGFICVYFEDLTKKPRLWETRPLLFYWKNHFSKTLTPGRILPSIHSRKAPPAADR